ncbi:MAG: TonB-dependent receptor [Spongiibacteraceae bacterium]
MKRSMIWLAVAAAGCTATGDVYGAVIGSKNPVAPEQTPLQNYARLETVIVSAPLHKSAAETALPVTVIAGDELRQRAGKSIGFTLDGTPGVASASFGPAVGQPVIRGQSGPRVKVLQNGIGSADASAVSADHAVTVEPLLAESVEVLRGPATLLYGGGAIGGVVNVIDNQIPRALPERALSGAIEQRHDSASAGDTSVFKLDGGAGPIAWHLDGVYRDWGAIDIPGLAFNRDTIADIDESSDGFIANSDGRNHRLGGGLSWVGEQGYIGFGVSEMRNKYGIPSGAHAHAEGAEHDHGDEPEEEELADDAEGHEEGDHDAIRIDMRQTRYDLAGEWRPDAGLLDTVRWRAGYTDYEHSELESGVKATTYTNETWDGRLELIHQPIAGWHGVLGLQLRDTNFAAQGEEAFIPESTTRAVGVFVVEDYHSGNWIYEVGLRADRDAIEAARQNDQTFRAYSASASVLLNFDPDWSVGAAFSQSQRAPTVEELYSNVETIERHNDHFHYHDPVVHAATRSIEFGSVDLGNETSRNLDLTLRYSGAIVDGFITAFHNDFREFIYLATTGFAVGDVPVLEYRQEDASFYGVEFNLTTLLGQTRLGKFSVDVYGDTVRGKLDRSVDVPRMPPWRIGTRLNWDAQQWSGYAGVLHAGDQNRAGEFESDTEGYTRLDAGVSYALALFNDDGGDTKNAQLFLRGTNLTDRTIRASTSFLRDYAPEPGRSVEAGVRLSF